jgi:hypothetical protein
MRRALVMTLLVRNEADILRENLRYHLNQGVDHFIVTSNRSDEATLDIIHEFKSRELVTHIEEPKDDYDQAVWVTRMARLAAERFQARWVINSDADEFWHTDGGELRNFFKSQSILTSTIIADRHDFICRELPDLPFWETMTFRQTHSKNALGRPLPPKIAHRGHRQIEVLAGNHEVNSPRWGLLGRNRLNIWHFPIRSHTQYKNKIRCGG